MPKLTDPKPSTPNSFEYALNLDGSGHGETCNLQQGTGTTKQKYHSSGTKTYTTLSILTVLLECAADQSQQGAADDKHHQ